MSKLLLIGLSLSIVLCSCGSGSSGDGSDSDSFLGGAGVVLAEVLILDVSTGNIESRVSLPADVTTNSAYRSSKMIFVKINGGSVNPVPSARRVDADEDTGQISVNTFYMSIFEVTQGQWERAMGTTPWIFQNSDVVVPVTPANDIPAYNLSRLDADDLAMSLRSKSIQDIDIPTDLQWEYACRAGTDTLYNWGNSELLNDIASNANVYQSNLRGLGPTAAGDETPDVAVDRDPNSFGLYDMHGNVSEWTSDNKLRGGSWADTVFVARSANKLDINEDTPHPLAGVRLVINP